MDVCDHFANQKETSDLYDKRNGTIQPRDGIEVEAGYGPHLPMKQTFCVQWQAQWSKADRRRRERGICT